MAKTGSKRLSKHGRRRSKRVFRVESVVFEGVSATHRGRQVRKFGIARGGVQLRRAFVALAKNPDLPRIPLSRL